MRIVNQHISTLAILLAIILNGCYSTETVDSKVIVRTSDDFNFEIEIPIHYEGRGNIHTFDLSKYEFDSQHWIYVNEITGELIASEITLTYERGKTSFPWKQSNLKGVIGFSNDSIKINLQTPIYVGDSDIPDRWENYRFNGIYLAERKTNK